ncbi:hypothetical protein GEMRC1_007608 [Eukaryota sp. GEM-RC1]
MCESGIIKCELRKGNVEAAEIALKSSSKQLAKECAIILKEMKQFNFAAKLFKRASDFEAAVQLYLEVNEIQEAAKLIDAVHSQKLLIDFGHKAEQFGLFEKSASAYLRAESTSDYVRILLSDLEEPEKAFKIIRKTADPTAAAIACEFCRKNDNIVTLIEMLFICGEADEACELALTHGHGHLAADYYKTHGHYHRALKLYLQSNAIDDAIDVVASSNNDLLIRTIFDFLMGDSDGKPKDVHHLFTLYVKLGHFNEAAKTAVIIAGQEIESGHYLEARNTLFKTLRKVKGLSAGFRLPNKLLSMLKVLHSYIVVRMLVKRGLHEEAVILLVSVVESDVFIQHRISMLISCVIECQKAGLRESGFNYASRLMQSDYVDHVPSQYRSKIEKIIRKRDKSQKSGILDRTSPCPFCGSEISITSSSCSNCRSLIPFCIVTGQKVVRNDLTCCPHCEFPAIYSQLVEHVSHFQSCPMCLEELSTETLEIIDNAEEYLNDLTDWFTGSTQKSS